MSESLQGDARHRALATVPAWTLLADRDALRRELVFRDFTEAWAFLTRVALAAERMDHHPEITNVWNRVTLVLQTHDAGGLTDRDIALARIVDALLPAAPQDHARP